MPTKTLRRSGQPLTAFDRCDGCAARAAVRVRMPSGRDLLLCRHHHTRHAAALEEQGATIEESHG